MILLFLELIQYHWQVLVHFLLGSFFIKLYVFDQDFDDFILEVEYHGLVENYHDIENSSLECLFSVYVLFFFNYFSEHV